MFSANYLSDNLDFCLYSKDIRNRFQGKNVIVYGAGNDGKLFVTKFHKKIVNVVYVIDSKIIGTVCDGVNVYGTDKLLNKDKGLPIIVASRKYWHEILDDLIKYGYDLNKNLFVWEPEIPSDENISLFIEHNHRIWNKDTEKRKNIVLVPILVQHDISIVIYAYCANYLAKKYNAEIWGYLAYNDFEYQRCWKSLWKVYQSFNVAKLVDCKLNEKWEMERDNFFSNIWDNVWSIEDVENISIYGYKFGKAIMRDYLRFKARNVDLKNEVFRKHLKKALGWIVYYHHFFESFGDKIKSLIMWDAGARDGYLRIFACLKQIPTYKINNVSAEREIIDGTLGSEFKYYRKFFGQLSDSEKRFGLMWAKKRLQDRLNGSTVDIKYVEDSVYAVGEKGKVLDSNDKIKVLICPHTFDDDLFGYGNEIFLGQIEWLCHLGGLSQKTDYDWYIKLHPNHIDRDEEIIEELLKKYPNIKRIPELISPKQLRSEGLSFAFTLYGSIGHEYPALGIHVINAGNNPHVAFNFNFNPKTRDEFDKIVLNLRMYDDSINLIELYQFYCIHFLFYKNFSIHCLDHVFFKDDRFRRRHACALLGTEIYKQYLADWDVNWHEEVKRNTAKFFQTMDSYNACNFYKEKLKRR